MSKASGLKEAVRYKLAVFLLLKFNCVKNYNNFSMRLLGRKMPYQVLKDYLRSFDNPAQFKKKPKIRLY